MKGDKLYCLLCGKIHIDMQGSWDTRTNKPNFITMDEFLTNRIYDMTNQQARKIYRTRKRITYQPSCPYCGAFRSINTEVIITNYKNRLNPELKTKYFQRAQYNKVIEVITEHEKEIKRHGKPRPDEPRRGGY